MTDNMSLNEFLDEETLKNIANSLWKRDFNSEEISAELKAILENKKNINQSFGERMKGRLKDLMDNPESYTPSYKSLYNTLFNAVHSLSPQQAYIMTMFLGLDSARGYQELPFKSNIKIPNDDAPQFNYQVGWHFFVGSCWDVDGGEYGVEFMFWQYSLLPPPLAKKYGLNTVENQILELHLGISKAGENHYRAKPVIISGTTGLVGFGGHPYYYQMGNNYMKSMDKINLFPLEIKAWGVDYGFKDPVEIEINLLLDKNKDYIFQGKNGCSPCCGGVGTLYYSVPNIILNEMSSKLRIGDDAVELSHGKFWYDHQWGSGFSPSGSPRKPVLRAANNLAGPKFGGWDWFMAQFEEDHELTIYALHSDEKKEFYHQSGSEPPGVLEVEVSGKYVAPEGEFQDVDGILKIDQWIKSDRSPDPAIYPETYTWYPDRWNFSFADVLPEEICRFTMTPIVDSGQCGFFASGVQYSEGAVYIKNLDGKLIGRGFAESTNYADTRINMLRLAGLSDSQEMMNKIEIPSPSKLLKLKSMIYLNIPSKKKELEEILQPCLDGINRQ